MAQQRFSVIMADLRKLLGRELDAFAAQFTGNSPDQLKKALNDFVPDLVDRYGQMAATFAADWYELVRADWGMRHPSRVVLASPSTDVGAGVGWALGPAYTKDGVTPEALDQVMGRVGQAAGKSTLQQGWDTIGQASRADHVRWARATDGHCCAWCSIMASRGAVYWTQGTAEAASHDRCGCNPIPVRSPDDYPAYYDPDKLYDTYVKAANSADTGSVKSIASEMRAQQGTN